jgi:hypothetical protein
MSMLESIGAVDVGLVRDEVLHECRTSRPAVDPPAQPGDVKLIPAQ